MAKALVEALVDDLDGSPAVETVRIGWNGDWREIDLSRRNLATLSRALDRYLGGRASGVGRRRCEAASQAGAGSIGCGWS